MSLKVVLHYEAAEGEAPSKTSKLTLPAKWGSSKTVEDVIGLFADAYNKANPDYAIDKQVVHLVTKSHERIYSNDIIEKALEDRADYYIKIGAYIREQQDAEAKVDNSNKLRCKNYGCGKFFSEEENHDSACRHHISAPIFHDTVKGWSCCPDKKAYDWETFQAIEGCTLGKHSTKEQQKIFTESPTVAAASKAENAPILKSISDYNAANPNAASAANTAAKSLERKSTRRADGTAKCQRKGCQKDFIVADNSSSSCNYHCGQPVFHDAIKFWSCCPNSKCYDFDDFLKVPPCSVGFHDDGEIEL